jgi:hypothetical protein
MLLLTRRPLRTRNWQIFTLKFWNTRSTHLTWPLRTTTSFRTSLLSQRLISPPRIRWRVQIIKLLAVQSVPALCYFQPLGSKYSPQHPAPKPLQWMLELRFSQGRLRRIPSSGMWRRVDLVWTDVSEERIASIFRVEKSASHLLTLVPRSQHRWMIHKTKYTVITTHGTIREFLLFSMKQWSLYTKK